MINLPKKIELLENRVNTLEEEMKSLKNITVVQPELDVNLNSTINIPKNLLIKIMDLDVKKQIPILWSFSSNPVMTVAAFLEICVRKGFVLSHSWLPSAGGAFSTNFVKKGWFQEVKVKGDKSKHWKLTVAGNLKIAKIIKDLN